MQAAVFAMTFIPQLPLAIDFGSVVGIIFMVISFIAWAVSQANVKGKQEDQKRRQAQAAQQMRQKQLQQQRRPPARQPAPRANQEQEVDAFLRSAAQQRQQQPQRTVGAPLPGAKRDAPRRPPATPSQRAVRPQQRPGISSSRPPTRATSQRPTLQSSAPQSDLYDGLEVSDFSSSAASMGHFDGHDDDLEQHVHDVFDHDIATLDDRLAARDLDTFGDTSVLDADKRAKQAKGTSADQSGAAGNIQGDIVEMFRNPANIRNAIVMQEVLNRPDF